MCPCVHKVRFHLCSCRFWQEKWPLTNDLSGCSVHTHTHKLCSLFHTRTINSLLPSGLISSWQKSVTHWSSSCRLWGLKEQWLYLQTSVSSLFTDNNHILIHRTWKPYQVFIHYKEAAANVFNSLQRVLVHCLAESIHTCNCVSSFGYCWKMSPQISFIYHSELILTQKNIKPLKYTSTFVLRYCPSDVILKKKHTSCCILP